MMKRVFYLALAVSMFLVTACNKQEGYKINGTINGLTEGTVYLVVRGLDGYDKLDSAAVFNGTFEMIGSVEHPDMVFLTYKDGGRDMGPLGLENSEIQIIGKKGELQDMSIEGSTLQDKFYEWTAIQVPFDEKTQQLIQRYNEANAAKDMDAMAGIEEEYNTMMEELETLNNAFINNNLNSPIAPHYYVQRIYELELNDIDSLMATLQGDALTSINAKRLENRAKTLKTVAIGQPAPAISITDTAGVIQNLADLKGNVVLVDFWASWCGPCRAENPNVVAAYETYHPKGFEIYAVSLDNKKENWLKAIKDDNLTWTHVSNLQGWNEPAAKTYGVMSIPASVLIDKDGVIIARNLRGEALKEKLAELLN